MIKTIRDWMGQQQGLDKIYAEDLEAKEFSTKKRKELAKSGAAMKDGSYPIENVGDLKRAVRAFGRSPDEATKHHIISRAKALGATNELPEDWSGSTKDEQAASDPSYMSSCEACQ